PQHPRRAAGQRGGGGRARHGLRHPGGGAELTVPPAPAPALQRVARQYLDHLTVERGLAPNTLASYRRDLDRYLAALAAAGVTDLAQVTTGHVQAHLAALRRGGPDHRPLSA